jgi:hypothetical protein
MSLLESAWGWLPILVTAATVTGAAAFAKISSERSKKVEAAVEAAAKIRQEEDVCQIWNGAFKLKCEASRLAANNLSLSSLRVFFIWIWSQTRRILPQGWVELDGTGRGRAARVPQVEADGAAVAVLSKAGDVSEGK